MVELTKEQKSKLFNTLMLACEREEIKTTNALDKMGNTTSIKLSYDGIDYYFDNVKILGLSILFRETNTVNNYWGAKELINFIKNNKWG